MVPVVLCAAGGILLGGSWSMRSQGAARAAVLLVALLGVLALAAGVLWLLPKGTLS
jgi:hypothetical protein